MQFSVLMSIYKKECPESFDTALSSIWDKQTLKPNEIILVEDGELTDGLYEVINVWLEKIPSVLKVIKLDNNVGTGQAKQIGLQNCSYNYVAIMDTDDIAIPQRFEKQFNYFKKYPKVILLGGQVTEFNYEMCNQVGNRIVPCEPKKIKKYARYRSPFNHSTVIFHRDTIVSLGGYQHHLFMEDYNLWLRVISKNTHIANLDETLVYMRVSNGMLSRRRGIQYIRSEWQLAKLKTDLKIQSRIKAFGLFLCRSIPRLFPANLLSVVYCLLRK